MEPGKGRAHVGFDDGTLRLYTLPGLEEAHVWRAHDAPICAICGLRRGDFATAGGAWVRVWSPARELRAILKDHGTWILTLGAAHDGTLFVSGGNDMTLRCWDAATATLRSVWTGHGAPVWSVAVSPSGEWVASGDIAGTVIVWNPRSGRPERKFRAHDGEVTGLTFHGDAHFYTTGGAFSVGGQGSVKAWAVATKRALDALPIEGGPLCVMRSGSMLWVGCQDTTIGRYRLALPE